MNACKLSILLLLLVGTSLSAQRPARPDFQMECPIDAKPGDSLETLKIKAELIKAWQAEQNAKPMAVFFGGQRLV